VNKTVGSREGQMDEWPDGEEESMKWERYERKLKSTGGDLAIERDIGREKVR